jgi:hypothetical protein
MALVRTQLAPSIQQTGERQSLAVQETLRQAQNAINNQGAPGVTLDPVSFTAFATHAIKHKLGRVPSSWVVVDVTNGFGSFQRISWDDSIIEIQCDVSCVATFRVA